MLHDWVSKVFLGPDVRTTQRLRYSLEYPMSLGISRAHLAVITSLLEKWGLHHAPFIISEDGTAQQIRADVMEVNGELKVYGFCGQSITVRTAKQFNELVNKESLRMATTLYVYTLVPLIQGAPHFPLFAISHDNSNATFTPQLIKQIWSWIWQVRCIHCFVYWSVNNCQGGMAIIKLALLVVIALSI